MKKDWPHYKIVVAEDNEFYNKLITRNIKKYIGQLALIRGFTFEVKSFTTFGDYARNLESDTDIVITDYYLNDGYNAMDVIDSVKRKAYLCKIIVLSQMQTINTAVCTLLEGACEFIYKDKKAIEKSCYIVEEIISHYLKRHYGPSRLN